MVVDCWARAGTITMPGAGGPLPAWGFTTGPEAWVPGPVFAATAGDSVQITLHNALAEPVSMMFPGVDLTPQPALDGDGLFVSFTDQAAPSATVTYTFPATRPGTYRYESGSRPERQVAMGLAGALIIRPAGYNPLDPATWTAYGPDTGSAYDHERLLILGEVDSQLRTTVGAGESFDMLNYKPDGFTINGRAFPHTLDPDDLSSQPLGAAITAAAGQRVLLRCVNSGFRSHALHFGGLVARVVAEDGYPLKTPELHATYDKRTLTIPPGSVYDVILADLTPGEYFMWDRDLKHVVNADQFPGGMMTRLTVTP